MSLDKQATKKLCKKITDLANKIKNYNKFDQKGFQEIYQLWTEKIRGLPVDGDNGKQLPKITSEKLRLINFTNDQDLNKLKDTEKNSGTSKSVLVNAFRLIDTCLGVKISGGRFVSASKLKPENCMFSAKDFNKNSKCFLDCVALQKTTNSAIWDPKNKDSILYALIKLGKELEGSINKLSGISAPVNIESMSVQPRRDINLDSGGFNQNENTPETEKRTRGDLAGNPGCSLLACLEEIKNTINNGTETALEQMLAIAKSGSANIEEIIDHYRGLCSDLSDINYDGLMASLDSVGESASAMKNAVSDFKFDVRICTNSSDPILRYLIDKVDSLRRSLLEGIKPDSGNYNNAKTCVKQILPGFSIEEGSANMQSLKACSGDLAKSSAFDNYIPKAIVDAKRRNYNSLMELTDEKTVEDFVDAYASVLSKNSKALCANFVSSKYYDKNKFEALIKTHAISDIESKETLDGNNEGIANEMSDNWQRVKAACLTPGRDQYDKKKLAEAALECGKKLIDNNILEKYDLKYMDCANSEKFVKIFIRYLERNYYDLKDDMRIFYYHPPREHVMETSGLCAAGVGRYHHYIHYLKSKSKTSKIIYFIINQLGSGHGNLTIIYAGKGILIDTAPNAPYTPVLGFENKLLGTLQSQSDTGNCVAMALGALEGFLNKIRELKHKETSESDNSPSDQDFGKYLDRFINAKVNIDYLGAENGSTDAENGSTDAENGSTDAENGSADDGNGSTDDGNGSADDGNGSTDDGNGSAGNSLYPPKYIRYLQSSKSINNFLRMAGQISESNHYYNEIKEVAEEFKKVKSKYSTELENSKFNNDRGTMKRQTEILKIFQFVEALENNDLDPAAEIRNVREL